MVVIRTSCYVTQSTSRSAEEQRMRCAGYIQLGGAAGAQNGGARAQRAVQTEHTWIIKSENGEISVVGGALAGEERGERSGRSGDDRARGTCAHIWPRLRVSGGQCRSCVLSADGRTTLSKSLDRNKQTASSRTRSWNLFHGRAALGSYLCRLSPSICFPSGP
ncbi:hypothetical protein AOLI_G00320930 [Acnodon oligacanthus]